MAGSKHVVVIGSGLIGASIAWHLAQRGAGVTVVDAGAGGGVATGHSFAWINASWSNPAPYFRLRHRSMAEWRRLATALPALPVAWTGGLCWDMPEERFDRFVAEHGAWGYGVRTVDQGEIRRLEPHLAAPPARAAHVAEEAAVEPWEAARLLLADAAARGARLLMHGSVTSLLRRKNRIAGVATADGPIEADETVIAAGTGAPDLLAGIGLSLAMRAPPGLLVHSRPHSRLLNGLVLAPHLHMRQTAAGRLVGGADFGGTDPGADPAATAAALFASMRAALHDSGDLAMEGFTIGHRPTPASGFPAIGRPQSEDGLYVAVMRSGVTLAPAVGLFAADELIDGRRDPLLAPYGFPASPVCAAA